jgi:hypothetical protein
MPIRGVARNHQPKDHESIRKQMKQKKIFNCTMNMESGSSMPSYPESLVTVIGWKIFGHNETGNG